MPFVKKPFYLGSKKLPHNVFYAPLAGCSDYPFRQMSAKYKPALMYCEMVKMEPLVRNHPGTLRLLDFDDSMRPIGAQLCGSNPKIAGQAAKMVEEMGFDVIDLNCGCPVDKVTKDGSGSGMLKNPELIGEVLANIVNAVKVPVTIKVRAGWDETSINAPEITQIAEKAGAAAIAVHGRTRVQAYRGFADWDVIKACKLAAQEIKVIGNGDVFDAKSAERMFSQTGCDAVLVSRGTMGQPWIVEDILTLLDGNEPLKRCGEDFRFALLEHFRHIVSYFEEKKALLDMRRVGCWYVKNAFGAKEFRGLISKSASLQEVETLIREYPYG